MIDLTFAKEYTFKKLESDFEELQGYCDKYPEINELVQSILPLLSSSYMKNPTEEIEIAYEISQFIDEIMCCSSLSLLSHSHSYSCAWVSYLNMFIGSYLLDDSEFTFRQDGYGNKWKIHYAPFDSDEYTQNPKVILAAAKDNVKFRRELREAEEKVEVLDDAYHNLIKRGMISSGEVEKYLFGNE